MISTKTIPVFRSRNVSYRTLKSSSNLLLPRYTSGPNGFNTNRTRITKEITPEEVQRFKEAQERARQQGQQEYSRNPYTHQFNTDPYYSIHIPNNTNGIITPHDPIYEILKEPTLVIERKIEFMNLFIGFEQANKYVIMNSSGQQIGYMEEKDVGIGKMLGRQFFRLHRPFDIDVYNSRGELALSIKRPFSWINSHIKALLPGYDNYNEIMYEVIGESVQSWHLWRRKYNLFKLEDETTDEYDQFGAVDAPFLSFDFPIKNREGDVIASIDRNWVGLGREMFTDTGVYILRFDPRSFEGLEGQYGTISKDGVTLDQRAVILSCFTSIDFDYFSRHSRSGGLFGFGGSYDDV
ncbi:Altered inheritance rate of mitochondria protein 25 [Candida tropicalis]